MKAAGLLSAQEPHFLLPLSAITDYGCQMTSVTPSLQCQQRRDPPADDLGKLQANSTNPSIRVKHEYWVLVVYHRLRFNINWPSSSESACSVWSMKKRSLPLSRKQTQCHVWWCLACGPVRSAIISQELKAGYRILDQPHHNCRRNFWEVLTLSERGWTGVSATSRHDVTFCLKTLTGLAKGFFSCVLLSVFIAWCVGVARLVFSRWVHVCVFRKRASRQEMTCPIVVVLDTV